MRLLDAKTLKVVECVDHDVPKYAILSHTWVTGQEVTLQEMQKKEGTERSGYDKIRQTCDLALQNNIEYAWVDTCCIDKTSSAELSEAINSMMSWYQRSEVCYTYLADVPPDTDLHQPESPFATSRWFERGWTLQELLAPSKLIFLYNDWSFMSDRDEMVDLITQITGIDRTFLSASPSSSENNASRAGELRSRLHSASIAEKMSWASKRKTTRVEDTAYSLLGIFGINMPLLYGEGTKAFLRLQEEIMKYSDDQTILSWYSQDDDPEESGVLATSPAAFSDCQDFIPCDVGKPTPPYQITNKGLRIEMPISSHSDSFLDGRYGLLQCKTKQDPTTMVAIPLGSGRHGLYVRHRRPIYTLNYQWWSVWPIVSVNLLPSSAFVSSITESPSYTVFLEPIPDDFYIGEVYPPDPFQQPDPRIIMTGTPGGEDGTFSRTVMVLLKSSVSHVEPLVLKIEVESVPGDTKTDLLQGTCLQAYCTFIKNRSLFEMEEEAFSNNLSLASLWNRCKDSEFLNYIQRQEGSYWLEHTVEYRFGKTLCLAKVTKNSQIDEELLQRGLTNLSHHWNMNGYLQELHQGWSDFLQRLSTHFRNSFGTIARPLVYSPWMFTFVVESLISRSFRLLRLLIKHIRKHWSIALCLCAFPLFSKRITWRLEKIIQDISSAGVVRGFRTNVLDLALFYLCCKLIPSELLEAVIEKDWGELGSVLVSVGLRLVVAGNGTNMATALA